MEVKKVIVCDLDGTLVVSKSPISEEMAVVLCRVLSHHYLAIVSGGRYSQFQKQLLSHFNCDSEKLKNLYLFPTMGSTAYAYDTEKSSWNQLYNEILNESERSEIKQAFREAMLESGIDFSNTYGDVLDDRGSQITFSGTGQEAPIGVKEVWDPDQTKRRTIIDILSRKIPRFEIGMGGTTSIDVTRKGINKAYAIKKIKELLRVTDEDIIFIGDALYKGGNDSSVKETGADYIQESGPEETLALFKQYL